MHKTMFLFSLLLTITGTSCRKEISAQYLKSLPWEKAKVISQDISSQRSGAVVAPIAGVIAAVPVYHRTNRVIVETETHRYEWIEDGNKHLLLTVGSTINFYREGNWFIVLDSKQKKHKFSAIHAELLQRRPQTPRGSLKGPEIT